ncbi:MAG: GntR family transcriptional regulator [Rhizobiales bacterium]|nr:GntR family transcriptional regulator [Hyphomicrobiales bacterium]
MSEKPKKEDSSAAFKMVPVTRETYQEQSYRKLRDALMKGRFKPGDTVSLRTLATELGTSPMPIREAVRHLIAEHALELRQNRTFVVPLMSRVQLDELRKVRIILEGAVAYEAALVIKEADIAEMTALQDEMNSAVSRRDSKRYLTKNRDFHFALYRSSNISSAVDIIETLWLRIGPSFNFLLSGPDSTLQHKNTSQHLLKHHSEILRAVRARDGDAARKAITGDINDGMRVLIEKARG